jgi:hypothetical protein
LESKHPIIAAAWQFIEINQGFTCRSGSGILALAPTAAFAHGGGGGHFGGGGGHFAGGLPAIGSHNTKELDFF